MAGQNLKQEKKVLSLVISWTTYITEEVKVAPAMNTLFITSSFINDTLAGWLMSRPDYYKNFKGGLLLG